MGAKSSLINTDTLAEDPDDRAAPQMRQQAPHQRWRDGDTPLRRRKALFRNVKENGRTAMAPPRRDVPVHDEAMVVKPVGAHHAFVAGRKGQANRPVVGTMGRRVAPAVIGTYRLELQAGTARHRAVCPHLARQQPHRGKRCCAVALALEGGDARPPQRAGKCPPAGAKQPALRLSRRGPHGDDSDTGSLFGRVDLHFTFFRERLAFGTNARDDLCAANAKA